MRFLWKGRVIDFHPPTFLSIRESHPCQSHDVCVSKLEVQKLARMPVNLQYLYSELL